MLSLSRLVRISRPRFWIYLLGPYLLGCIGVALSAPLESVAVLVGVGFYFTLPANLLLYGVNDIFDYDTDKHNPKKQEYEALVLPNERRQLALWIALLQLPWLVWCLFLSFPVTLAMLAFKALALCYSVPPIRTKAKPFLDSLTNVLYIVPGLMSYFVISNRPLNWPLVLAAGLWAMAMHIYSAIPDIQADKAAYLNTTATFLRKNGSLTLCTLLYLASALIAAQYLGQIMYVLGLVYLWMMRLSYQAKDEQPFLDLYKWFPRINTIVGFVLFLVIIFR